MKNNGEPTYSEQKRTPLRKLYLVVGMASIAREDLEQILRLQKRYSIYGFGVCLFDSDISEGLISSTIERFRVIGFVSASRAVKGALANK